jgi:Protein of unknown function (DUF3147)
MIVHLNLPALRETHWYEYLIRFVLGGAMTVITGLIAARFGPIIGGLFLAFPAILPATVTLVEKHVRQHKEKVGLSGVRRGQRSGCAGCHFAAFAVVIWLMIELSPAVALVLATAAWLAISMCAWALRRWL